MKVIGHACSGLGHAYKIYEDNSMQSIPWASLPIEVINEFNKTKERHENKRLQENAPTGG